MIGAVVTAHIYDMLKEQHKFDTTQYVKDLKKLPNCPRNPVGKWAVISALCRNLLLLCSKSRKFLH